MVFHWSLSDSKSLQVSRSLLNILADFNNAVVLILPRISNTRGLFFGPLGLFQTHQLLLVLPSSSCSTALFRSQAKSEYYFLLLYFSLQIFTAAIADGFFYWSLSDSKSPHISRTLLSILADLNNKVVRIVSVRPLISNSFRPLTKRCKCINYNLYHHRLHVP